MSPSWTTFTTVKKVHNLLADYFRYLAQQELIPKNPMLAAPMIKKSNFMASQGKENRPTFETVTTFSPSEITELYYVKKGTARLSGITAGFEL